MEINQTPRETDNFTLNEEKRVVLDRDPRIQLYLDASNLKIKENTFYEKADEKLDRFIREAMSLNDNEFILGLARFLADNGLKLSPVILLAILSNKGMSFRGKNLKYIFNTPQRIAEAIAIGNMYKLNNSFKKNILRPSLERMSEYTLFKNQMFNKKIKTKDLIKLLRPTPANEVMSQNYKKIIEGTAKFQGESLVRTKSNNNLSDSEKLQYYLDNIERVPLNELIRNLRFISDKGNFSQNVELQTRILNRLNSIDNFRFFNIFDLIETAISVPQLELMLFEVIKRFALNIKETFNFSEDATFLFDLSGSMEGDGIKNGFKYLVLLSLIFNNTKLRYFATYLENEDENGVLNLIKDGRLSTAFKKFNVNGGTALLSSTKQLLTESPEINNLIIISDEVSWEEGDDLRGSIMELSRAIGNRKVILINPTVYKGTVFRKNIMAFASLTSSIVYNVSLFVNPNNFIKFIKEQTQDDIRDAA